MILGDYTLSWITDEQRALIEVTGNASLTGADEGLVRVHAGHLVLVGWLEGSVLVQTAAQCSIYGVVVGSVIVASGAVVRITGAIGDSIEVAPGALVVVEAGAEVLGSISNAGSVVIRGLVAGVCYGPGELRVEVDGVDLASW